MGWLAESVETLRVGSGGSWQPRRGRNLLASSAVEQRNAQEGGRVKPLAQQRELLGPAVERGGDAVRKCPEEAEQVHKRDGVLLQARRRHRAERNPGKSSNGMPDCT